MDPYVYRGSNVLRNLRDLRVAADLAAFEGTVTSWRIWQLVERKKLVGQFDISHLQAIHRHIFQDVYDWAGRFRSVNIARPGQFYFAMIDRIVPVLNTTFTALSNERCLTALAPEPFAARAAFYMGELNAIHPFRDGNGRAQREFIRQLALNGGHIIHWSRINREQMGEASRASFQTGKNDGLAAVILAALVN